LPNRTPSILIVKRLREYFGKNILIFFNWFCRLHFCLFYYSHFEGFFFTLAHLTVLICPQPVGSISHKSRIKITKDIGPKHSLLQFAASVKKKRGQFEAILSSSPAAFSRCPLLLMFIVRGYWG
jgi:hypothetical protein